MRKTPPVKTSPASPAPSLFDVPPKRAPKAAAAQAALPKAAQLKPQVKSKPAPAAPLVKKVVPATAEPSQPAPTRTAKLPAVSGAKTIPVKADPAPPAPVRVVAETPATYFAGTSGRAWRMNGKHAVAYVRDAALAGELSATEPRQLAQSAMAVYYDRKGKPFAWQFRFDTARWEEVTGRLA